MVPKPIHLVELVFNPVESAWSRVSRGAQSQPAGWTIHSQTGKHETTNGDWSLGNRWGSGL